MNSDPYDSAAWKTFGMLDAEESALFDDAMRQDPGLRRACLELDRLAAAIAATSAEPLVPRVDELERLRRRLGLRHAPRNAPLWLAVTGWCAALASTVFLVMNRPGALDVSYPETAESVARVEQARAPVATQLMANEETARLTAEIDSLRRNLEDFHERDRVMFQLLPGRALPLVMVMLPPGETMASAGVRTSLTAMLGDALAAMNRHPLPVGVPEMDTTEQTAHGEGVQVPDPSDEEVMPQGPPMAVPIYDAARDSGTLVVSNLQPAGDGMVYHLWVVPAAGVKPVYLGSLPESSAAGADSFDFSLGSTMVMPAGYLLTLDAVNAPKDPSESNTILSGPPVSAR